MHDEYCSNGPKRRYESKNAALVVRKTLNRAGRKAKNLRAYFCPHCYGWHLTSHNMRVR